MKHVHYILGLMIMCSSALDLRAGSSDAPYDLIAKRNIFGLNPPPSTPSPTNFTAPPPKVILTGIITVFGDKRALLKTASPAAAPTEAKGPRYYMLAEGQRDGDLEILQVDEKAGTVALKNAGVSFTLGFSKETPEHVSLAPVPPKIEPDWIARRFRNTH